METHIKFNTEGNQEIIAPIKDIVLISSIGSSNGKAITFSSRSDIVYSISESTHKSIKNILVDEKLLRVVD